MVIVYGEESNFDQIANELTLKNGAPILKKTIDNSSGAHWSKSGSYIMLLRGIKGTQIKLPVGRTDGIKAEEIILIIGKRPDDQTNILK